MKILITGGTGLIGTALTKLLVLNGHEVSHLSRSKSPDSPIPTFVWNPAKGEMEQDAMDGIEIIVHLAGAGIADGRWTDERKKVIIDSRVESANLLYRKAKEFNPPLKAFISASGISYYGMDTTENIYVETDPPSTDFIGKCCVLWEEAADQFAEMARVVKLRTGIVLSQNGGALEKIAKPVKLGAGAPLGSGDQWVPYIHIDDLCEMYKAASENENYKGVYNAVNGDHITNKDLTKETAKALKKPLWLPNVPSFAIKAAFGEMGRLILEGSRASANRVKEAGFNFQHRTIRD
ncbi:MAG TPA: TIGR01777 family oxidoreductase, partial [Cryomorphaceae bacterium]|nr:TIGR01777 family oxidoreductase [Cryomorphaceae bacterium]